MTKKIWITGASSGIGKALAIKFAQDSPYPSTDTVMDYIFSDNKPMEQ